MKGSWLATNPEKRRVEVLFLAYSPFWISWALLILVPFKLYEVSTPWPPNSIAAPQRVLRPLTTHLQSLGPDKRAWRRVQQLDELGYMAVGLMAAVPCVALPWQLQTPREARKPWPQRHWVKANVWIAILSFVGNYFWTHYFFQLLGAAYTFKSWRLNNARPPASHIG